MANEFETAKTQPQIVSSVPPKRTGAVKPVIAGVGGFGVAGAITYYALTSLFAYDGRIGAVEVKVDGVESNLKEVRADQKQMLQALSRIEGYILRGRDEK